MNRFDRSRAELRPRDVFGLIYAVAWFVGLALSVPCDASAQALSVAETESLVRTLYYEGLPEDEAARIGPEGCDRLVEMLADPAESPHHAQILLAIGLCAPPDGFEAIRDWADTPRIGEIDRNTYRAWQALPFALGHLAEHDRRAIARLESELNRMAAPSWTFRQHRGARLVGQARRAAAMGLALSGLPEAAQALDRAERSSSDESLRRHLEDVREVHRERGARRAGRVTPGGGGAK